ncbi:50S ribosomal protein L1 [Dunaliella salina]|uniref:50S ribosomal protein L1 n=1 Tax=Dunaliella salina TaxID=3046 RepID=A0ABQ7GN01_DUNSA|nr:50S ribosomal protein L1 [Dunaliella salina]|eukprot:KAF5835991.1 50S ribosomal protein L1 [Dunaliella salina]
MNAALQADQVVRGIALLPHGTGKRMRVAVFAKGPEAEEALKEGVEVLGDEELIQEIIEKGEPAVKFDRLVATPAFMKPLARAGRVLGPLGLMPNPKVGTLTTEVAKAVQELRAGRCEFRMTRDSQIMTVVGKASFPQQKLEENVRAFVTAVVEARPKGLPGQGTEGYIRAAYVKSSMTPAVAIRPETCVASPLTSPAKEERDQEPQAPS